MDREAMLQSARYYHDTTSYQRSAMAGGHLDWSSQPEVYKRYRGGRRVVLSREVPLPQCSLGELTQTEISYRTVGGLDLEGLSALLRLTCAITARARYPGGDFLYRSVPSAGALYPCEIYLAPWGVEGLSPALYHYSLQDHSLVELRSLKPGALISRGTLLVFITVMFFRSAWKYRDRAYRYLLLDTGHLLENLVLALRATGRPHRISLDFPDEQVNSFLGLDPQREACLAVVEVGHLEAGDSQLSTTLDQEPCPMPEAEPLAPREAVFPLILQAHMAGSGTTTAPRGLGWMMGELGLKWEFSQELEAPQAWLQGMSYVESLWSRRSKRAYVPKFLDRRSFSCLMGSLPLLDPTPCHSSDQLTAIGLLAGRVEGLTPGFYLMESENRSLHLVAQGDFLGRMAAACLDQGWMAQAALQVLFLANLDSLESLLGSRGYRHAMILSGRMGQRIYLASTALGLGACGVGAFYDREARALLGLNESSRLLYVLTSGPVRSGN